MILKYLAIYIVVLSAAVAACRFVPWWGAFIIIPAAIVLLIMFTIWRIKRFFRKAMQIGIERMGWSMIGATVVVHSVTPRAVRRGSRMRTSTITSIPQSRMMKAAWSTTGPIGSSRSR